MGKRRGYQGSRGWENSYGNRPSNPNANYNGHGHYGSGGTSRGRDDEYNQQNEFSNSGYRNNNRYSNTWNDRGSNNGYYDGNRGGSRGSGGGGRPGGSNSSYYTRTPFSNNSGGDGSRYDRNQSSSIRLPHHPEHGQIPSPKKEEQPAANNTNTPRTVKSEQNTNSNQEIKSQSSNNDTKMELAAADSVHDSVPPLLKRPKHDEKIEPSLTNDTEACIVVSKENWDTTPFLNKLKAQYPFNIENHHIRHNMQEDTSRWFEKKCVAAAFAYQKTMEDIVAVRPQSNPFHESDSDSDGIEDSMFDNCEINGQDVHSNDKYTEVQVKAFTDALPYNLLIDAGFRQIAEHKDDEKNCFCPCRTHSKKWRDAFAPGCELNPETKDPCSSSFKQPCDPNSLMAHLKKIGFEDNGFLHRACHYYLEHLYKNYWGHISPNVDHKALYIRGTPEWDAAVAAGNKHLLQAWRIAEAKLEEQKKLTEIEKKRNEKIDELKKLNEELAEKYRIQVAERKTLGIKPTVKVEMSSTEFDERRKTCAAMLKMITVAYESQKKTSKEKKIEIKVPPNINIQMLFDEWYRNRNGKGNTAYLFRDLSFQSNPVFHNNKIMQSWDIKVEAENINLKRNKLQAIDQGGPTRQFIEEFCTQMRDLVVFVKIKSDHKRSRVADKISYLVPEPGWRVMTPYGPATVLGKAKNKSTKPCRNDRFSLLFDDEITGNKRTEKFHRPNFTIEQYPISLFDTQNDVCFPVKDENFKNEFDRIKTYYPELTVDEIIEKAMLYYRAVGRMLLHLIFDSENTMASTVMPHLLRNYLLRGLHPNSESYEKEQLYPHVTEMHSALINQAKGLNFSDYFDEDFVTACRARGFEPDIDFTEVITKENCLRKFAPLFLLETRHKTLNAMKEGLTLGGTVDIASIFRFMPLGFVSKFLFSNRAISLEDVISVITKDELEEEEDYNKLEESIRAGRETFLNETLPETLRILSSKNTTFLSNFLYFVTGSGLMPHLEGHPDYRIQVEFTERVDADELPMASTCANLLLVPLFHYDNDVDKFTEKLDICVGVARDAGFGFE